MYHQEVTFGDFGGNINGNMTLDKSVEEDSLLCSDEEWEYASTISLCYSEEEPYYDEDWAQDEDISADVNGTDDYYGPELPDAYDDDFYTEEMDALKLSRPSKDIWMKTWPKEDTKLWVNVYGWHNDLKGYGGYAVIVRNMSAKPIIASARFSLLAVSYLHQVLKGLKAGLDLASEHGCSSPRVLCNSKLVTQLLNSNLASGSCSCEIKMVRTTICKICMSNNFPQLGEVYVSKVVPLIETLQAQRGSSTLEWDSMNNEAVHYLAKKVKMSAKNYGHLFYKTTMKEPEKFPDGLVDILWHDAYDRPYYNLDERAQGSITNEINGFETNSANGLITAGERSEGNMSTIIR